MKIISWNSEGARLEAYQWRLSKGPDLMVVQECGNLPKLLAVDFPEDTQPQKIGALDGYDIWWLSWSRKSVVDGGNLRCSLAMFYKGEGAPTALESNDNYKRPVMRKGVGSSWTVYNIHAGGKDYIEEVIKSATVWTKASGHFVVVGDFNQTPKDVATLGSTYTVVSTGKPTRPKSGREIDFAVSDCKGAAALMPDYGGSDHISVAFEF